MNKVILTGNVGKDPEVKHLESGTTVANFSLATNESYTNRNGEKVQDTEWHNIVAWGKIAETIERYVFKGSKLLVEGKIRTSSWEGRDGNTHYKTEVLIHNFEFIGAKPQEQRRDEGPSLEPSQEQRQQNRDQYQEPIPQMSQPDGPDDDLPF